MKYTVKAIENAKPGMKWEDIGCHWTLGQAYLYSKEAGNDLPNFAEVIWDNGCGLNVIYGIDRVRKVAD